MGAAQVRFVPTLAGQSHQRGGSQSLERMVRISSMNGPQSLELSVSITGIHTRTYFYMSDRYKLKISDQDRKLFEAWSLKYPVKPWEAQRNQLVSCRMGWGNPFVGKTDQSKCRTQSGM